MGWSHFKTGVVAFCVSSAGQIIAALIDGMNIALPNLVAVAVPLLLALVDGILQSLPQMLSAGHTMLLTLVSGITGAIPELLPQLAETVVLMRR